MVNPTAVEEQCSR